MSIAPPGSDSPSAPPEAATRARDAKAEAAAAKAYAKAQRPWYKRKRKRWWAVGLVLLTIIWVAGSGSGSEDPGPTASQEAAPAAQSEKPAAEKLPAEGDPTFKNGVLVTPDVRIRILRHKVIKVGQKGNKYGEKPVLALWYETTNLSGEDVDPTLGFISNFNAHQDNNPNAVNDLDVGLQPEDRFIDSQTETIKKGGTVENAITYELDDLVTPVQLIATHGLGPSFGKTTYRLR